LGIHLFIFSGVLLIFERGFSFYGFPFSFFGKARGAKPPTTFWELPRWSDRTPYLVVGSEVAGLARVCQTELICFLPDEAARVSLFAAIVSTLWGVWLRNNDWTEETRKISVSSFSTFSTASVNRYRIPLSATCPFVTQLLTWEQTSPVDDRNVWLDQRDMLDLQMIGTALVNRREDAFMLGDKGTFAEISGSARSANSAALPLFQAAASAATRATISDRVSSLTIWFSAMAGSLIVISSSKTISFNSVIASHVLHKARFKKCPIL
jgi:hypothetical protein